MKPSKCRVMCPDCGKAKMQFETENAAQRFIEFNGADISEHPEHLRVYYCPSCCCYHISSKKHNRWYDNNTSRLIKAYKTDVALKKEKQVVNLIRDVVALEPNIKLSGKNTGNEHITHFEVSGKIIFGVNKRGIKYDLRLCRDEDLEKLLEEVTKKHFKI